MVKQEASPRAADSEVALNLIVDESWGVELAGTCGAFLWRGDFDIAVRSFASALRDGERVLLERRPWMLLDWDAEELLDIRDAVHRMQAEEFRSRAWQAAVRQGDEGRPAQGLPRQAALRRAATGDVARRG